METSTDTEREVVIDETHQSACIRAKRDTATITVSPPFKIHNRLQSIDSVRL